MWLACILESCSKLIHFGFSYPVIEVNLIIGNPDIFLIQRVNDCGVDPVEHPPCIHE